MKITNIALLKRVMERNYADYQRRMLNMCGGCVFEAAAEIAAVREAYCHVTAYDWANEEIAGMLLVFGNPLSIIVNEWREYKQGGDACFEDFAFQFAKEFREHFDPCPCADSGCESGESDEHEDMDGFEPGEDMALMADILKACEKHIETKARKLFEFDDDGFFIYDDDKGA